MSEQTQIISPADIVRELLKLSLALDQAHSDLVAASHDAAAKDALYRKTKATAYVRTVAKTVGEREAHVDLLCGDERHAAHLADSLKTAALERVRSIRQQMNCLQSVSNAVRSEYEVGQRWSA